jgi:hypothetical protein
MKLAASSNVRRNFPASERGMSQWSVVLVGATAIQVPLGISNLPSFARLTRILYHDSQNCQQNLAPRCKTMMMCFKIDWLARIQDDKHCASRPKKNHWGPDLPSDSPIITEGEADARTSTASTNRRMACCRKASRSCIALPPLSRRSASGHSVTAARLRKMVPSLKKAKPHYGAWGWTTDEPSPANLGSED